MVQSPIQPNKQDNRKSSKGGGQGQQGRGTRVGGGLGSVYQLCCVRYILAFLYVREGTCETRKNVFYFNSKALFVLKKAKFQNFRNAFYFGILLMKFDQFMLYYRRKNFMKKLYKNFYRKTSPRSQCLQRIRHNLCWKMKILK